MKVGRIVLAYVFIGLLASCSNTTNVVTANDPCGPSTSADRAALGIGIVQCAVEKVESAPNLPNVTQGAIYSQLKISTSLAQDTPILQGEAARSLYDKVLKVLGHSKNETIAIQITPSVGPSSKEAVSFPSTIVASLSYSDEDGSGPVWRTTTHSEYASPVLVLSPRDMIFTEISLKVSDNEKSDIQSKVNGLNETILGLFPAAAAGINTVSQVTGFIDSTYNGALNSFKNYDQGAVATVILQPLASGALRHSEIVVTSPKFDKIASVDFSIEYSTSLLQDPVNSLTKIQPLDWSQLPDFANDLHVVRSISDKPSRISAGQYLQQQMSSQLTTLARHGSETKIEDIGQFCEDAAAIFRNDLGLNTLDTAAILNQELYSSIVNLSRFSRDVRLSNYCLNNVERTVIAQNGRVPGDAATGRAVWTTDDSGIFGKAYLLGQADGKNLVSRFATSIDVVDKLSDPPVIKAVSGGNLQSALANYAVTAQACYTVPVAKDNEGKESQVASSRIIVGHSSKFGNLAFELQPPANAAAGEEDKLGVLVVRKPVPKDYSPGTADCKEVQAMGSNS